MHGPEQVTRRVATTLPGPEAVLVGRLWLDGLGSPAGF